MLCVSTRLLLKATKKTELQMLRCRTTSYPIQYDTVETTLTNVCRVSNRIVSLEVFKQLKIKLSFLPAYIFK